MDAELDPVLVCEALVDDNDFAWFVVLLDESAIDVEDEVELAEGLAI